MNIIKGVSHPPARMVIYGPPGVGKSSFACGLSKPGDKPSPDVLAIDFEHGLEQIGPNRVVAPDNWSAALELVAQACTSEGSWKTLVIDTADRLETLAIEHTCKVGQKGKSLPDLPSFGFGEGYQALAAHWRKLLFILEGARPKGREVILVCHMQSKIQDDPTLPTYSKFIAALHKTNWQHTHQWADAVLFACHEQAVVDGRIIMTGNRLLKTEAGSGFDAKNRWRLPAQMPLSWPAFAELRSNLQRSPDDIRATIRSMATAETKDKAEAYITQAGESVTRLFEIETALRKTATP